MSLRHLNDRIQRCSLEMDKQRRCTRKLLEQQRSDLFQAAHKIPLPAVIGLALVGGFIAQRFIHSPSPSRLFHLYLTWRAL